MTQPCYQFDAIGTRWRIAIADDLTSSASTQLHAAIRARIDEFDRHYSRFRSDSLVTYMGQHAGHHSLPPDGYRLLSLYERLYQATDGRLTPLIGQTMEESGYDAQYSLQSRALHQPPAWPEVLTYGLHHIALAHPVLLDFGAAGKGYLVDIVAMLITHAGVHNFTIDAGGDVLHRSSRPTPWRVGLENPLDAMEVVGVAEIHNQSLCASSGSRRTWGAYHHIIDPHTLESPRHILATWVVAADTITADGLATALFFTSPQHLRKYFDFSYAILAQDMSLEYDPHFPVTAFEDTHA